VSVQPEAWVFAPNSQAQADFFRSTAPEVIISSAYGKGKSRIICEKSNWLCLAYPGARVVLARKQRAHMGATTLRTLLDEVLHPAYLQFYRPSADGGSCVHYPNGSQLLVVGLDNPGRARSGAFTAAYVDQAEELTEEEWNAIGGRLRWPIGPYRQLGGACNPDAPDHFLFRRFRPDLGSHVVRSQSDETLVDGRHVPRGTIRSQTIISGPRDNYSNLPLDYILRLTRMTGRYRQRYVEGMWVAFEGQVYDCWNPFIHVRPRPKSWDQWGGNPPPSWRRVKGVDFGYVNPFVHQWWAISPEGVWWRYREIYMTNRTVTQHSRTIKDVEQEELEGWRRGTDDEKERLAMKRIPFSTSVADHDAEDIATLLDAGLHYDPAIKDVGPGIQTVYEMLTPFYREDRPNDPQTRMIFASDSLVETDERLAAEGEPTRTEDEMGAYRRPKNRAHIDPKDPKEAPLKFRDHGCDTARYCVHTHRTLGEAMLIRLT